MTPTALQIIDALGVLAFALSGLMTARRYDMDIVGLFVVAFATAFGGGTLRDLLLDRTPLFWIEHDWYAMAVLALTVAFTLIPATGRVSEKALLIADAVGLGLFAVAGAGFALATGTSIFIASLMGMITGTFGGVIRDVLCNEVPSLFKPSPLYATCAFAGALLYLGFLEVSVPNAAATWIAITFTALMRLGAVKWQWQLPVARH